MSTDSSAGEQTTRSGDAPAARLPKTARGPRPEAGAARDRARPAARTSGGRPPRATPRRVRLTLSRVDPWSVMKIAFLLSVAAAIAGIVMVAMMWLVLSGMGVFSSLQEMLTTLEAETSTFDLMDYIGFGRVVSLSVVIGVIDVVLVTAVATLGAFLYNVCASLVGGVQLTLSDE
ncbi:DUF3566 domain-containing protein [Demetria terragena]|uniref:DUF3566 domain-containing protein n=1 Tax=Demetria terragena TaxID=63959 RepID=UPI0012EA2F3B|nr:DUF3566 domain-containing protein [Demetria terragena]